jgi:ATP phosphoribosyltransferase regulatory subunit HisZ
MSSPIGWSPLVVDRLAKWAEPFRSLPADAGRLDIFAAALRDIGAPPESKDKLAKALGSIPNDTIRMHLKIEAGELGDGQLVEFVKEAVAIAKLLVESEETKRETERLNLEIESNKKILAKLEELVDANNNKF